MRQAHLQVHVPEPRWMSPTQHAVKGRPQPESSHKEIALILIRHACILVYLLDHTHYSPPDTGELPVVERRHLIHHPLVVGVLVLAIGGLVYLAYRSGPGNVNAAPALQSAQAQTSDGRVLIDGDEIPVEGEPVAANGSPVPAAPSVGTGGIPSADIPAPATGAFVSAKLNIDAAPGEGLFVLSGRVPDEETAAAVTTAAESSYAPFVQNELEIDPSLEPAPWLAEAAPQVVGVLPIITDGTIMVADKRLFLSARSPNEEYIQLLQGSLNLVTDGMPLEITDTKITGLVPPYFNATYVDDEVTLTGFVPSEQEVASLYGGAVAAYGKNNVVNNLTVDPTTYSSFWMRIMPLVYQLFLPFDGYVFDVADGVFSGSVQGGFNFDVGSDLLTDSNDQALSAGIAVLSREPILAAIITGHTDDDGTDEYNQELSLARAQAVVDFLASQGITPDRLVAVGAGESEPIADNSTEEGKARNRRVEFQFGYPENLADQ